MKCDDASPAPSSWSLRSQQAAAFLVLFALWEALPRARIIDPVFVPPLSVVLATTAHEWRSGLLSRHALVSLCRAWSGLACGALVGVPAGFLLGGWFANAERFVDLPFRFLQQANPVVLFHVIVLFLGIGEAPKIFIVGWLCTWPMLFGTIAAINSIDPQMVRIARAFGCSRMGVFWHVVMPATAPAMFASMRIAAGQSFVMLVAAEMMGTSSGLGWYVVQCQESFDSARIFAGVFVLTLFALVTDALVGLVARLVTPVADNP
jgi:NitT/TauT family transport system permease protein